MSYKCKKWYYIYTFSKLCKNSRFTQFFTSRKKKTFHNVMILIKSVSNKEKSNYYCNIFLEKALYELPEK